MADVCAYNFHAAIPPRSIALKLTHLLTIVALLAASSLTHAQLEGGKFDPPTSPKHPVPSTCKGAS